MAQRGGFDSKALAWVGAMFADSHVHLDLPQFAPVRAEVIRRAGEAGVELMIAIAMASPARASIADTLGLADANPEVYAAIGVHPHDARDASPAYLAEVARAIDHPKVVLWGEIGLDYHYKNSPAGDQRAAFRNQLRLARRLDLPVAIHCRDAWPDLIAILGEESAGGKQKGILHNFAGDPEYARICTGLGLLISFSGIITFHGSDQVREAARSLRLDQVLIETDSPYVAPAPHRGRRNEPSYVVDVALGLAQAMDVSVDDIARNTTRNLRRLIGLSGEAGEDVLVYTIRDRLYINLTSRCTAHCVFCRRESSPVASGYDLHLSAEHGVTEYLRAIGDPNRYAEIIFCGFGEPTLRLPELLEIGRSLKARGCRLRMNTNGHGNLIHGRDIVPDLATCLDEVSISIDAGDAESYDRIVRPDFGPDSFRAVIEFVRACKGRIAGVTLTAVDLPNLDLGPVERLARELGVGFRAREYQPMVGSTDFTKLR
jgi:TatD DNase family protein